MSAESLSHFFELAAKYAWAVLASIGFVLLVPDHIATQLGFASIRAMYLGYLWLLFVFSGTLALSSHAKSALWGLVLCPVRKLIFPVRDFRTDITQSRMRYYLVQFTSMNCNPMIAYQEVDSNGNVRRYVSEDGKHYIPAEKHECSHIGDAGFKYPGWRRMDWRDVFNGDINSGCWGITER